MLFVLTISFFSCGKEEVEDTQFPIGAWVYQGNGYSVDLTLNSDHTYIWTLKVPSIPNDIATGTYTYDQARQAISFVIKNNTYSNNVLDPLTEIKQISSTKWQCNDGYQLLTWNKK